MTGKTTTYESVEERQTELDVYLGIYNGNLPERRPGVEGIAPDQFVTKGAPEAPRPENVNQKEVKTGPEALTSAKPGVR